MYKQLLQINKKKITIASRIMNKRTEQAIEMAKNHKFDLMCNQKKFFFPSLLKSFLKNSHSTHLLQCF